MEKHIAGITASFKADVQGVDSTRALEEVRLKYLGRKGLLQSLMPLLKEVSPESRPHVGKSINDLKEHIETHLDALLSSLSEKEMSERLSTEAIDVTLPGRRHFPGRRHILTQMIDEVVDIHRAMGFSVQTSPEIESEYYNYGGLNYPEDHPARDMQDTYYITNTLLLRSHTTAFQQHVMEGHSPPLRVMTAGKCYRNETISARSHVLFHQFDAMYIDKGVTFADLIATQKELYSRIFNQEVELRVRPSYFPFVEPGLEVDIRCTTCKGAGCRLCKHSGWLEVSGAGMIHPEVLKAGGVDPEIYSGYAWGGGIERLVLLRHGVDDIRLFMENDLRLLSQF